MKHDFEEYLSQNGGYDDAIVILLHAFLKSCYYYKDIQYPHIFKRSGEGTRGNFDYQRYPPSPVSWFLN